MNAPLSERITKARMRVILEAPFFGALLMRLKMVQDDSIPTMCTDGETIRYNSEFSAELEDAELRGVLVHEVAHCAQGHLWRCGDRDVKKWNGATDYQINEMLETYVEEDQAAFAAKGGRGTYLEPWKLPAGGLRDAAFKGLCSEEIYNLLPDGDGGGKDGKDKGKGQPSPGEIEPVEPGDDNAEAAELEAEWTIAVTQAATAAKMRGQLPASLERFVHETLQPKVPWREVLREFIRRQARDDYSWGHPNRRYVHTGVILPGLRSERMGRLAIGVDTSGSISDELLAEFQAEVQGALDECSPEAIDVIYCDAAVQRVEEFQPGDAVKLQPFGGGGTDFVPVFEYLAEAEEPPVALIYLTDGYGNFPKQELEYPVLWATVGTDTFPFGQVVAVK